MVLQLALDLADGADAEVPHGISQNCGTILLEQNLLRVMIVVAGAGPHASGMPELLVAPNASSHSLASLSVLVTDGRVSYQNEGISIAHVVPEALDGGGLPESAPGTGYIWTSQGSSRL